MASALDCQLQDGLEATGTAFVLWVALLEEDVDALVWVRMYKKEVVAEGDGDWQFLHLRKLKLNTS